jgi:hypothetical protein
LSRVYGKLHVRAAAYSLWGLSKMGFTWKDLQQPVRSLAGGREVTPLAETVSKFLRQRVASMREHEYAVLLYSLGCLGANLGSGGTQGGDADAGTAHFPDSVIDKIHHRATRVGAFLTSRSLANALFGLGLSGVLWAQLPESTRLAWENALLDDRNNKGTHEGDGIINSDNDSDESVGGGEGQNGGIACMRSIEFAQVLRSFGLMKVQWVSLREMTQIALLREMERRVVGMKMTLVSGQDVLVPFEVRGFSAALWGLASMGCPASQMPVAAITLAKQLLQDKDSRDRNGAGDVSKDVNGAIGSSLMLLESAMAALKLL